MSTTSITSQERTTFATTTAAVTIVTVVNENLTTVVEATRGPQGPIGATGPQGEQGIPGPPTPAADNTATIGLTRIQGVAATAMRSDAAPPLSQAIVPTWTGQHIFAGTPAGIRIEKSGPVLRIVDSASIAEEKIWDTAASAGQLIHRTRTDAGGTGSTWLTVDRTGTAVDSIALTSTALTWNGSPLLSVATLPAYPAAANPSASVGLAAVDGVGTTFMRSDAAPALSQAITPTWTGLHKWQGSSPRLMFESTGAAADQKIWHVQSTSTGGFTISTRTDADGTGESALVIARTGTNVDTVSISADGITLTAATISSSAAATWTGTHTFSSSSAAIVLDSASPLLRWRESDAATDEKLWRLAASGGDLIFGTRTDANAAGTEFLTVTRTGTVVDSIALTSTALTWNGSPILTAATAPGGGIAGNPTASVALAAVNGVATTYMRSDAAPPLSQAIAPTWTSQHKFTKSGIDYNAAMLFDSVQPGLTLFESDAPLNEKVWSYFASDGNLYFRATRDDATLATDWLTVVRTGTTIDRMDFSGQMLRLLHADGECRFAGNAGIGSDVNIRPSAGKSGWVSFSETGVADRWAIGIKPGESPLVFGSGSSYSNTQRAYITAVGDVAAMSNLYAWGGKLFLSGLEALTTLGDGYLRINHAGTYTSGIYTPGAFRATGAIRGDVSFDNADSTRKLVWGPVHTYGTLHIGGPGGAFNYVGIAVNDGAIYPCFMANATNAGIFGQGDAKWIITRDSSTTASTGYNLSAPSFTSTSSRKLKRETGKPSRAADILSRLRPILYRLLADDTREQLGLIAEEVHDICPQLSDGKTVSYDRLALLLLADWQESRGLHSEA